MITPDELVFGLDIGTRNVVGSVGYKEDKVFHVIAHSVKMHETRAMLDGQIKKAELNDAELVPIMKEIRNALGAYREKAGD